jgi:hypothetical protein
MSEFYYSRANNQLRFGDVIQGGIAVSFILKHSQTNFPAKEYSLTSLDINNPIHSVIITPCCSIGKENKDKISIVPLLPVKASFMSNPYFAEDLLRINREMEPEKAIAPDQWDRLPTEERFIAKIYN